MSRLIISRSVNTSLVIHDHQGGVIARISVEAINNRRAARLCIMADEAIGVDREEVYEAKIKSGFLPDRVDRTGN